MKDVQKGPVVLTDNGVEVAVLMPHSHYVMLLERYQRLHAADGATPTIPAAPPISESPK